MREEILLNNVKAISEKYEFLRRETGGDFNIFEIANISTKEVAICRVLHDLLSPNGSHHQGDKYLKLFVANVLKLDDYAENGLANAKVYREYMTTAGRRIDLVIKTETPSRFIPIEVKIYADEQEKQCKKVLQCYTTEKTPILRRLRRNTNGVTEVIQVKHKGVD